MSGHSKWSQIKHQKAGNDARRGQLFTKLARELTIAAREGGRDPDDVALQAIDAGAEDVKTEGDTMEIFTTPTALDRVRRAMEGLNLQVTSAESTVIPKTTVAADDETTLRVLRLVDRLEELDD